ncbi:hypothetical protein AB0269_01155 [Microbacterium sp. NPDC077644]|uniref:hypothetical protein n=1 Tax=Microbacterium sp. NPDC077644 TaxID=3155055 RepID=UPI00344F738B
MGTTRSQLLIQTIANAANTITLQAIAILSLSPSDYGMFSFLFIGYAWFLSISYSVLSEPWARARHELGTPGPWRDYASVAIVLSLASALPVAAMSMFVDDIVTGLVMSLATALAVYRAAARFRAAVDGKHLKVWLPDALGTVAMITLWLGLSVIISPVLAVAVAWLAASAVAATTSLTPGSIDVRAVPRWWKNHSRRIRVLFSDSLLQDLSTVLMPLVLAPIMGLASFGVYRALFSTAMPVRLLLTPLRPAIGNRPLTFFAAPRTAATVFGTSVGIGAITAFGMWVVSETLLDPGTTLAVLGADFAVAVGIFIAANGAATFYYFVARTHLSGRELMVARVEQLIGIGVGPIAGFALWGLPGAVWGVVFANAVHAVVLPIIVFAAKRPDARRPT